MAETVRDARFLALFARGAALLVAAGSIEVAWLAWALAPVTTCSYVAYNETCSQAGSVIGSASAQGAIMLWSIQGLVGALVLLAVSAFLLAWETPRPAAP